MGAAKAKKPAKEPEKDRTARLAQAKSGQAKCAVCMATFQSSKAKVLLEHAEKHVGTKKAPGKTPAECFPGVDLTLE